MIDFILDYPFSRKHFSQFNLGVETYLQLKFKV